MLDFGCHGLIVGLSALALRDPGGTGEEVKKNRKPESGNRESEKVGKVKR